jgi:hypothetical protein
VASTDPPTDDVRTIEHLLVARLRQLGVRRTYGAALHGLDHVPVGDPDLAVLLADADGRIGHVDGSGRLGAATLAGPILHLSSAPGGTAPLQTIGSVEELVDALADPPGVDLPGTLALHLDLDLREPLTHDPLPSAEPERAPVLTLDPSLADLRLLALAGPGVVRTGSQDLLQSFSRAAGAPVLATWGAMGLERWDSPFHAGVGGLQSLDLALGGLDEADIVIATGIDRAELAPGRLDGLVLQEVPPRQLGVLCRGWPSRGATREHPSVRAALAPVLTPLWESDGAPVTAARAALHLSGALPDDGLAVADPGPAGFWVARATPTSFPGAVCVPATVEPGFAAAAALVASLDGRPCLAVTDEVGAAEEATAAVLDVARVIGAPLAVQVWGGEGVAAPDDHVSLLRDHLAGPRTGAESVRLDRVHVDLSVPDALVELAGPVVAWSDGHGVGQE